MKDYLKFDGRFSEPPYDDEKDARIAELEAEVAETIDAAQNVNEDIKAENERLRHPACGTEQVWLDTIRHDDEQALIQFKAMQRESELKKEAMEDAERYQWLEENSDYVSTVVGNIEVTDEAIDAVMETNDAN